MNLSILLVALSATTAVSAKHYMHCPMALDGTKMLQDPYCCMGYKPAPNTEKAIEGQNCELVTVPTNRCQVGGSPLCCYEIGPKKICTSHAAYLSEEDV